MSIDQQLLRKIIEGALLAAGTPLSVKKIQSLFDPAEGSEPRLEFAPENKPDKQEVLAILQDIEADCQDRGFELKETGSGWRFQVVQETAPWISRLWEEKPQRYSRALLETLALIAYRQPITRGDIESVRGVAVSSNIIKTLLEREWVKVVGHRDVPGRPALYATTKEFLDYFNIKSLDELPSLKEIQDIDSLGADLDFSEGEKPESGKSEGEKPDDPENNSGGNSEDSLEAEDDQADTDDGSEDSSEAAQSPDDDAETKPESRSNVIPLDS